MWSSTFLIQLVASLIGSVAFAIIFKMRPKYLPYAAFGGGITFFAYYAIDFCFSSVFAAAFIASAISALYSEICARIKRAPAIVFVLPCAIPIVPGGSLYRTMFNLISQNYSNAWLYFSETLKIAIGIAGGIAAITLIFHLANEAIVHIKRNNFQSSK